MARPAHGDIAPLRQASQASLPTRPEFLLTVKLASGMNSLPSGGCLP
jgi:hypothetical protein